jgi:hypothetical protein
LLPQDDGGNSFSGVKKSNFFDRALRNFRNLDQRFFLVSKTKLLRPIALLPKIFINKKIRR